MKNREAENKKKRETYKYRSENGLCVQCGKKLDTTGKTCLACKEIRNEQSRMNYAYKKMNGHCVKCGADTLPGVALCEVCKLEDSERHRKNFENVREKNKERSAERRERLRNQHCCTHCGKPLVEDGYVYCAECRRKQREYNRKRKDGKRKVQGTCLYCELPAANGYSFCAYHLEKQRDAIAYARRFSNHDIIRKYLHAEAEKAKKERDKRKGDYSQESALWKADQENPLHKMLDEKQSGGRDIAHCGEPVRMGQPEASGENNIDLEEGENPTPQGIEVCQDVINVLKGSDENEKKN